ncbi:hypothetical protein LTR56_020226 [Elasticomyces elasticus]|nr:hypothetical protein LTR56_020226 [Elasticomyces elasticus]KAK3633437.1 hypothetical protein LTR22_020113 [Elasticomyces elasticus]KAK4903759.1 hypothetical protein LTR49_026665 [Elasticomyces elasticus]KAK5737713.1 hypothetical protein LTS12_025824 [Elasticomyces elasticus]
MDSIRCDEYDEACIGWPYGLRGNPRFQRFGHGEYARASGSIHSAKGSARCSKPRLRFEINVPARGIEIFAHWLKEGEVEQNSGMNLAGIKELCSAYQVGRDIEVPTHFLDEVMDQLLDIVTQKNRTRYRSGITIHQDARQIILLLREVCSKYLTERDLLVDWIVHDDLGGSTDDALWDDSTTLMAAIGPDTELKSHLLEAMLSEKLCKASQPPWSENRCVYHLHKLRMPCYRKQKYLE